MPSQSFTAPAAVTAPSGPAVRRLPGAWSAPELAQAARRGEFLLHYQPVVSLVDGTVEGLEALLRWRHPRFGMLAAESFVDAALEAGVLVGLLPELFDAALDTAAALAGRRGVESYVAVNVDATQLGSGSVVAAVDGALAARGTSPGRLLVEVTERADWVDLPLALAAIEELSGRGIGVAIDDFGTGHSSLLRLKDVPARALKIDRRFVRDVVDDPDDQAIVSSVVFLAERMGLSCVGEGVESPEQAAMLVELGCTSGQGFLWSGAVAPEQVPAAVRRIEQSLLAPAGR